MQHRGYFSELPAALERADTGMQIASVQKSHSRNQSSGYPWSGGAVRGLSGAV